MFRMRLNALAALMLAAFVSLVYAEDQKPVAQSEVKAREIRSKAKKYESAASVNFAEALGVELEPLNTLGARIDQARKTSDPFTLACLANELAVAEQVAGKDKKATLTANTLLQEAVQLATARRFPAELQAVALIVKEEKVQKEMAKVAREASAEARDEAARIKDGEKQKELHGELEVHNHTHHSAHVYVSGRYVGYVPAHQHRHFHVHDHRHVTILDARSTDGLLRWHEHLDGHFHSYTFELEE